MNFCKMTLSLSALLLISATGFATDHAVSASKANLDRHDPMPCTLYSYSIQKIGPTIENQGELVTYHVILSNIGDCKLRDIDVRDRMPKGMTFVSANPIPTAQHDGRIRWEDVDLKPGRYMDFQITGMIADTLHGDRTLTNTSCAFAPQIAIEICDIVNTFVPKEH